MPVQDRGDLDRGPGQRRVSDHVDEVERPGVTEAEGDQCYTDRPDQGHPEARSGDLAEVPAIRGHADDSVR